MQVKELMSKKVVKVTSVAMLPDVAKKMRQENIGAIPVEENGRVVGIVTDRDIATHAVANGNINCQVKEVMTRSPATIPASATPHEAIQTMLQHNCRRLPVTDGGGLVGMLSLEDLVEAGQDQDILKALKRFHQQTKHG